ncbi:MAG TPA: hypothetical protein VFB62_18400 [Polyangiaceae bacterium]|nr:hypothetical protein [Polyangiaceae bacterium]
MSLRVSSVVGDGWRVTAEIESTPLRDVYAGVGPSGEVCIKVWRGPDAEGRVARLREVSRLVPSIAAWRWDGRIGEGRIVVEDWIASPWLASPAPREQVVAFLDRALELLSGCHAAGVVHGGIAPWRIGRRGERLCIRGFDRALLGDARVLRALAPPWSAPEHAQEGRLGPRADVFSLGVVALFLLAGRAPSPDKSALELAHAFLRDGEWLSFFERALLENPDQRWPTAAAMRRALHVVADIQSSQSGTVFTPDPESKQTLPFARRTAGTGTAFSTGGPAIDDTLPFGKPKPAGTGTVFGAPAPSAAPAPAPTPPVPAQAGLGTVFGVAAPVVAKDALPFQPPTGEAPPSAVEERAQPATGTVFGARAPGVTTLPFGAGPAHAAKLASDESEALPLERYAAIRSALWRDPERTDEILAREGLDRIAWHCYEGRTLRAAKSRENLARLFDAMRTATTKR